MSIASVKRTELVVPRGYPMKFNLPGPLWAHARPVPFAPLHRLWTPLTAVACHGGIASSDVLHTMNTIPLFRSAPWVVTFESVLPRTLSGRQDWLFRLLRKRLLDRSCRGIIAMSEWARSMFLHVNEGWPRLVDLEKKLQVLHPTISVRSKEIRTLKKGEPIRLLFVGHLFALKGGIAALRLAKLALSDKLPLELHIISGLKYGRGCFGDHPDVERYRQDFKLMGLPNVHFHGRQPNEKVLELMGRSHLTFLGSLHETYGFSILESFASGIPAITTNVCAQPEINGPDRGILLTLPVDQLNRWSHLNEQTSPNYWEILDSSYESLALQAFRAIQHLLDSPETIERLSAGALQSIETRHDPTAASMRLREIYGPLH